MAKVQITQPERHVRFLYPVIHDLGDDPIRKKRRSHSTASMLYAVTKVTFPISGGDAPEADLAARHTRRRMSARGQNRLFPLCCRNSAAAPGPDLTSRGASS